MNVETKLDRLTTFPDSKKDESTLGKAGLDQSAFLKIFLTQLQNQDPLQPKESGDLAVQLAQFTQVEQGTRTAASLQGVSDTLEEILKVLKDGSSSSLDPLSLLGHQVDLSGDQVQVPGSGPSTPLRFSLPSPARALGIEVQDASGATLGTATLQAPRGTRTVADPGGGTHTETRFQDFPRGVYELGFTQVNGQPELQLLRPDGVVEPLTIRQATSDGQGGIALARDASGQPLPFHPGAGETLRLKVGGVDASGAPLQPATTVTATADGVRLSGDEPVLTVGGIDVPLSQILRIR
ncbi:MAG: flagellar hook assembly protein FlgD [Myxococcota bacterium]